MNSKLPRLSAISLLSGIVAGCGGGGEHSSSPPPATTNMMLDSAQVLSQAQKPSETAIPYTAADGVITITDTAENTTPIVVNSP